MASVWKPRGKKNKNGVYKIAYVNVNGKRTTAYGCADLEATWQIARKLEGDAKLTRRGVIDPREATFAAEELKPLAVHLEDWITGMRARKVGDKHVRQMQQCMAWIADHAGDTGGAIEKISGFTVSRVQAAIASRSIAGEDQDGDSLTTLNRYVDAARAFAKWLAGAKRTRDDQMSGLKKYKANTDRRYERRALSEGEDVKLVNSAEQGGVVRGMSGKDRAMLYRVILGTGFRLSETASLTPESFRLESDRPSITVRAAHSKRRREDVQPISRQLADILQPWLEDKTAGERVFGVDTSGNAAKMLRVDLSAAGIEHKTPEGVMDIHSLRHTYITRLVMGGERVKVAQTLARHSTSDLTLRVYTHLGIHDLQCAVDRITTPPTTLVSEDCGEEGGVCMRAGDVSGVLVTSTDADQSSTDNPENAKNPCETRVLSDGSGVSDDWSHGESNPDLLNAIQPSSR